MKLIKNIKCIFENTWIFIKHEIIIKKYYFQYLPFSQRFITLYISIIALFIFIAFFAMFSNGEGFLFPYKIQFYQIFAYPILIFLSFCILVIITIRFKDFFDKSIFPLFYLLFLIIFISFIPNGFFFKDYYVFSTSVKEKTVKELKIFLSKEDKKASKETQSPLAINKLFIPNLMPYKAIFKPAELVEKEKKEIAKVKNTLFKKPKY